MRMRLLITFIDVSSSLNERKEPLSLFSHSVNALYSIEIALAEILCRLLERFPINLAHGSCIQVLSSSIQYLLLRKDQLAEV